MTRALRPFACLVPIVIATVGCATAQGSQATAVEAASLCDEIVAIVCRAEADCCAHANAPADAGAARADAGAPSRDGAVASATSTCTTSQRRACDATLGALATDSRLGYVASRGGALVESLRARAHACWREPYSPSELRSVFAGTASEGERCTPRGTLGEAELRAASLACGQERACRLFLDGATSAPEGECQARLVLGDEVCTHPYDCPAGRYCDVATTWAPGLLGECQPLRAIGWDCAADIQCASGYCDDDGRCATRPEALRCLEVPYSTLVDLEAPLHYFRLGDTTTIARDASPSAEHGRYVGEVSHARGALGASDDDGALVLDGAGHLEGPTLVTPAGATRTFALWVAASSMDGGGPLLELVADDASMALRVSDGHVAVTFVDAHGVGTDLVASATTIDSTFHRIVLTVGAEGTSLTVDDAPAIAGDAHALPTEARLVVGFHDAATDADRQSFRGSIDELVILDHAPSSGALAREAMAASSGALSLTSPVFQ